MRHFSQVFSLETTTQVVDSVVGRDAILRPIVNRPSPRRRFLPLETTPKGQSAAHADAPLRHRVTAANRCRDESLDS